MRQCAITLEMLLENNQGRVDAETRARIEAHDTASCLTCREHTAWMTRFTAAMQAVERVAIPANALLPANALFREKFVRSQRPSRLAQLVFDSRSQARPAFARGENRANWQRLYQVGKYTVELWQEDDGQEGWYVIGLILPAQTGEMAPVSNVLFIASDGAIRQTLPQEGEFHAGALSADTYQICLQSPEENLLLPDVRIGA